MFKLSGLHAALCGRAARTPGWAPLLRLGTVGTSSIFSVQPTAAAYLFSEATEGACFPAASRR